MSERRGVCVFVHGRGRGHATRCLPVIEALGARGEPVHVFAGPGARAVLEDGGVPVEPIPTLPPRPGFEGARLFARRVLHAVGALRRHRPRAVVSDGDHPGLVGAALTRTPALALGHGLVFARCARPEGLPVGPWRREATKADLSSLPARAFVPVSFCPLEVSRPRTWLAQPDVDPALDAAATTPPDSGRRRVLTYFRERDGRPFLERLRRHLAPRDEILAFGDTEVPDGVRRLPEGRRAFVDALRRADLVAGTAGSNLIAECVHLGRPLFALFPREHDEQRLNVGLLEAAGLGTGCPIDQLDDTALAAFCGAPPPPARPVRWAPRPSELVPRLIDELSG